VKQLLLATRNKHKVKEIKELLTNIDITILTLDSFPDVQEVIEDQLTLEGNAAKKALEVHNATGMMTLADDTGLEVDYLNGKPGVFSSRFAGDNATYDMNNEKLLKLLAGVPWDKRTAIFRCVMAIVHHRKSELLAGICNGFILNEKRGHNGFGYDPLFFVPEYHQTFAEMDLVIKNKISHRGKALLQVRDYLTRFVSHT
jgi:XTP/dITP diphosphohydrolase